MTKHKVFISYHHDNDQWAKETLLKCNEENDIFIDGSVDTGDISDDLSDEEIRKKIRDEYLRDTTVTILLVGTETKIENILIGNFIPVCMMVRKIKNQAFL